MKKIIVLMVLLAITGSATAELLYNGNLDIPATSLVDGWSGGGSGSGSGWNGWGAASAWRNVMVDGTAHSGDQYLNIGTALSTGNSSWWGWAWSALWGSATQGVHNVSPGDTITASAYVRNAGVMLGSTIQTAMIKLEWLDAAGVKLDMNGDGKTDNADYHQVFLTGMGDTWFQVSTTAVVPATDFFGNPVAAVGMVWGNEGTPFNFDMDWDTLSMTPEPITMALLGLGGLFIRRRKA